MKFTFTFTQLVLLWIGTTTHFLVLDAGCKGLSWMRSIYYFCCKCYVTCLVWPLFIAHLKKALQLHRKSYHNPATINPLVQSSSKAMQCKVQYHQYLLALWKVDMFCAGTICLISDFLSNCHAVYKWNLFVKLKLKYTWELGVTFNPREKRWHPLWLRLWKVRTEILPWNSYTKVIMIFFSQGWLWCVCVYLKKKKYGFASSPFLQTYWFFIQYWKWLWCVCSGGLYTAGLKLLLQ